MIIDLSTVGSCAMLAYYSIQFARVMASLGAIASESALRTPQWLSQAGLALGMIFICLVSLELMLKNLVGPWSRAKKEGK